MRPKHTTVVQADSQQPQLSYRPNEAAAMLGISRSVLFTLLADGSIKSFRLGASRLIPRSELEAWLRQQMREAEHV